MGCGRRLARRQQGNNRIRVVRSDAVYRASNEYGCFCIYCEEYFPNARKVRSYVCKDCCIISTKI